jgi:hypothetical protein
MLAGSWRDMKVQCFLEINTTKMARKGCRLLLAKMG